MGQPLLTVTCGVPQGSLLGPQFFFLLYISIRFSTSGHQSTRKLDGKMWFDVDSIYIKVNMSFLDILDETAIKRD